MTERRGSGAIAICVALTGLLGSSWTAFAVPTLDATVGLAGRVVPGQPAPIRVTLADVPSGATLLRITQDVGNAWRGETAMSFEMRVSATPRGDVEAAIPIYDAVRPLRLELLAVDGRRLAEKDVELRPRRVEDAFQVAVGAFSVPLPNPAASVSLPDLPKTWSAYAAAESVWIGRTRGGLDAEQWDAMARWVLSGGSLVVFAGAGLFVLDAPRLRDLLPVRNPTLADRGDDAPAVTGDLRRGATVLASREGAPWLVGRRYGGGNVLLVTTDALTLDADELVEIRRHVPSARTLSLAGLASELLDLQPVDRPSRWVAALLTLLGAVALPAVVARLGGRRSAAPALCAAFAILALFSWIYTDSTRVGSDLYRLDAHVLVEGALGLSVSSCALTSASHQPVTASVGVDAIPYEPLPPSFESRARDVTYRDGAARMAFAPGERRVLVTQSEAPVRFRAWLAGDEELRLTNRGPRAIENALLLVDGEVFRLPPLDPGEGTVYLSSAASNSMRPLGPAEGAIDRLFALATESFALGQGAWLVAGEISESRGAEGGASAHARNVTLYVVEVGRD